MKKLLVVISFLTLFMVAHATVKEVAVEYLTAEQVSLENDGMFGEVNRKPRQARNIWNVTTSFLRSRNPNSATWMP